MEAGVDSIYLRSLMRHQSLQMTLEYYIHLDDEGIYKRLCRLPSVEGPHRVRQKTSANS